MSTLSDTNVSFDGMRDLFDNLTTQGSTSSWSLNNQKHIDRCPVINGGQGSGKVPVTFGQSEATSTTSMNANDFKSIFKVDSVRATATTGTNKNQTQHNFTGFGTLHGMYAASKQNITNNNSGVGVAYDGTNTYTGTGNNQNFITFDDLNSNFNSNKDIAAVGFYEAGFTALEMVVVFRGSGASATDTDWSNMYLRTISELHETAGTEDINIQMGGVFANNATSGYNVTTYSNILYGPYYRHAWILPNVSFAASSVTYVKFD
tara:strand:- start:1966 stop:2751 length:786 start_codon:yes stop_codon:yes gene_type:complete